MPDKDWACLSGSFQLVLTPVVGCFWRILFLRSRMMSIVRSFGMDLVLFRWKNGRVPRTSSHKAKVVFEESRMADARKNEGHG